MDKIETLQTELVKVLVELKKMMSKKYPGKSFMITLDKQGLTLAEVKMEISPIVSVDREGEKTLGLYVYNDSVLEFTDKLPTEKFIEVKYHLGF